MNSNAAIFPTVYFFFPETTHRSLEEMDRIFHKTSSIFNVVDVARNEPHMYGKHGELLHGLGDVEDEAIRHASILNKDHEKDDSDGSPGDEKY